ncbi:MAG: hypothetical protein ACI6PR_19145 [Pseudoalteromonas sp.]|uniref:hypothetical protein n=1 Tax=Pseudoalteromonas sp. TaxID=53249 RepID=UPI00384EE458
MKLAHAISVASIFIPTHQQTRRLQVILTPSRSLPAARRPLLIAHRPNLSPVGVKLAHAISETYIFKPMRQQARRLQVNLTPSRPSLIARCPLPIARCSLPFAHDFWY